MGREIAPLPPQAEPAPAASMGSPTHAAVHARVTGSSIAGYSSVDRTALAAPATLPPEQLVPPEAEIAPPAAAAPAVPAPEHPAPVPAGAPLAGPPAPAVVVRSPAAPRLDVDLSDPAGLLPSPTVLSVPGSVMRRFELAREKAASHTGLVLDALRAHADDLPALVLAGRPGPRPDDLFPWRPSTGELLAADRPEPLRVRPTVGELSVIDQLVTWVTTEVAQLRPGSKKANRSEVVTAALRAYLPSTSGKRR